MKALDTRKSALTKRQLADALKKLLCETPFGQITVSKVIARCGVSRKTFYYHFEDLTGLLRWMLDQEAEQLAVNGGRALPAVMEYAEENREVLLGLCRSVGRGEVERFFSVALSGTVSALAGIRRDFPEGFGDFLRRFYTCAMAGSLTDWVERGGSREKTARYLELALRDVNSPS